MRGALDGGEPEWKFGCDTKDSSAVWLACVSSALSSESRSQPNSSVSSAIMRALGVMEVFAGLEADWRGGMSMVLRSV